MKQTLSCSHTGRPLNMTLYTEPVVYYFFFMIQVQQEIDDIIVGSKTPSMDDQRSMPFTMATIMEIQRYRVASPFVPPRCTNQDVNIQGTHIPKGTQIWVNLWAVLHDPMLWVNPGSFDPTRFLADNGKRVVVPEAFIPFGAGS